MLKSLFYFEKLKIWEIGVIVFYFLLSVEFFFFLRFAKSETQDNYIYFYAISTQLLLYPFFYLSMRNLKVFLFCIAVGVSHLCLYYLLKENASLIDLQNNTIISLRNTLILLVIFQILRYISLKTQKQELVCEGKNRNGFDVFNTRKTTRIDSILEITYFISISILLCC